MAAFLQFLILTLIPISSLSLPLIPNSNFDPEIALLGDAKIVNGDSHVQLVQPLSSSSGLLIHKKPFRFLDPNGSKPASFSTDFSFSISPGKGDGLAFIVFPYDSAFKFVGQGPFGVLSEKKYMGIEYDTKMDDNVGDLNANHVGIDVNSFVSVTVSNVSSMDLVLNNGEKLKSWIDYDSSSQRIEVRLSKFGEQRPDNPILAHHFDLSKMWGIEDVYVGIVSSNGNSKQISSVYSWNFRPRKVPSWMHSYPVNPSEHKRRSACPLKILAGVIFATGCGALLVFVMLFVWAIVVNRHMLFPIEDYRHVRPGDFRYEKVGIVVEENSNGVKN